MRLGKLEFEVVRSLEENEKYMTLLKDTVWRGVVESFWMVGRLSRKDVSPYPYIFYSVTHLAFCGEFRVLTKGGLMNIYHDAIYFRLISCKERIQEAMEKRAHDAVLRKVLGDPCFTWYNGS